MPRVLIYLLLLLPLPAHAAQPVPVNLEDLQQQLAETLEANDIPGAAFALVEDGEIRWAGGIGYASVEPEQHVISATRFRIGSVTKMFTALAILQLVEQGALTLDTPVVDIAPVPIDNPWHATHPVTVAHLLEHTAGFDDMHFRNMNTDDTLPASLATTVARLEDELVVRWQPGVMHSYSNPGYALAGYLVEQITGQAFHEYVSENILAPMGMQETVWGVPADRHFAQGYTADGETLRAVEPRAIRLYPAGELSASPADLARTVLLFLQRGEIDGRRILGEELIARMELPQTTRAAAHGLQSGYGLGNYTSFRNGIRLHGHNGGLDGFTAALAYSPEHNFGYAVLINRPDGAALKVLEEQVVAFLAQAITPPEPGAFDQPGVALPENIEGCYRMANSRNELLRGLEWLLQVSCVEQDEDSVLVRHPVLPQVTRLVPVEGALLRETDIAWPTGAFMSGGELDDALQWSGIYFKRAGWASVTVPLVLVIVAAVLMLSALLFAPVWSLRWLAGDFRGKSLAPRAWSGLAILLLAFTLFMATQLQLSLLDSINAVTVSILLGGIAFALASFYALWLVVRTWNAGIHRIAKWHTLLVALACTGVAAYLIYWQLVPLRMWAW